MYTDEYPELYGEYVSLRNPSEYGIDPGTLGQVAPWAEDCPTPEECKEDGVGEFITVEFFVGGGYIQSLNVLLSDVIVG